MEFIEVQAATATDAAVAAAADLFARGCAVYVLAQSEAEAIRIDGLLWTFDDQSFIPHSIWRGGTPADDPVLVGWSGGQNPNGADTLVLAGQRPFGEILETAKLFGKVVDLVPDGDETAKRQARERFRAFRDAGLSPVFRPTDK